MSRHTSILDTPPPNFTVTTFVEGCSRSDRGRFDAAPTFFEISPHLMPYGPMALSPLLWAPEVQASKRSAEDAAPRCPIQLALSHLASQQSTLHWYMAWNGVTPI